MKNKLEDVSVLQIPAKERHHVHIINGNSLCRIYPSYQRLFGELAYNKIILCPSKSCQSPFFLTDDYKEYSIKSLERIRRGESQTYIVRGSSTKLSREWKSFLKNDENITAIYSVCPNEWHQETYEQLLLI